MRLACSLLLKAFLSGLFSFVNELVGPGSGNTVGPNISPKSSCHKYLEMIDTM